MDSTCAQVLVKAMEKFAAKVVTSKKLQQGELYHQLNKSNNIYGRSVGHRTITIPLARKSEHWVINSSYHTIFFMMSWYHSILCMTS